MRKPNRKLPELTPQDVQRFWNKVDKTPGQGPNGDCWEWTAHRGRKGYGEFGINNRFNVVASRIAYYIATGMKDPGELLVRHQCDNRPCCNPAHLLIGTSQDDANDRVIRERVARGDRNGSRTHPERLARGDRHGSHTHPERFRNQGKGRRAASLSEAERQAIVDEFRAGGVSHKALGRKYNLGRMVIAKIIARG